MPRAVASLEGLLGDKQPEKYGEVELTLNWNRMPGEFESRRWNVRIESQRCQEGEK